MLVQVIESLRGALLDLVHDLSDLLRQHTHAYREESLLAVLDAVLLQALLDRVLRSDVINNLVAETLGLHSSVSFV